jgi:hypothetical protein
MKIKNLRPIEGFPDYFVSVEGNVYSKHAKKNLRLLRGNDCNSILSVVLRRNYKSHRRSIARLVMVTFSKEKIENYVLHKDGDYKNNNLSNLCWSKLPHEEENQYGL